MIPAFEVRELVFGYGDGVPVLDGFSIAVPPGTVMCLLGANGSGKSTLLRLMVRTLRPRSGRIEIFGRDLASVRRRELARTIAVVSQEGLGETQFTVGELVAMGRSPWQGRLAGETRADREIVSEAVSVTGLSGMEDRMFAALSGGERQRVHLAMALAQGPSVLLLDEPTSHLDIKYQIELLDLVTGEARRSGRTVIMVLHDLNLAADYADRLALLSGGGLLAEGAPSAVLTQANIYEAFGVRTAVTHGADGRPHVVMLPNRHRPSASGPHIHIIGGGGAAANLLAELSLRGYHLTLGVVNQGDLDEAVAADWGVETITVPPSSPVSAAAAAHCRAVMGNSSAVVLANTPFGPGNLENLRLALTARLAGIPVLSVAEDPMGARDYTGGQAAGLMKKLMEAGAEEMPREQMVAARLDELISGSRIKPV